MTKVNNIILASIFIVPMASMIPIRGTIVWYPQLLALMALGLVCLALLFWNTNKFISLFLIYGVFSYLFICSQSPRSMLCLITGYLGITFSYFISQQNTTNIYKALIILAFINILFIVLQIFKLDPIFVPSNDIFIDRTVGFMGSRNQLAIFSTAVSTVLMAISPWFLILALPMFLVKCSTTIVGLTVGLNTFLYIKGYFKFAVCLTIGLLVSSTMWVKFGPKSDEIAERLRLWKLTVSQTINGELKVDDSKQLIKANPLFGFGIGNFFVFSPHSQKPILCKDAVHRYEHAHNDPIEAFFEFGYIGVILILLCISQVISDFITCLHLGHPRTHRLVITFCSLLALSICSLGVYVFHAPVSLFMFCIVLGLFYKEVNNAKQSQIA